MAQNVVINGVTYQSVPEVDIPKSGGGTAKFMDTADATLSSGDEMLSGKTAYANGTKITGTITSKSSSDLTASGATVTAPAGYYASSASKAVASGSATAPATISGTSASVSTGTNTITLSKTISVTPSVSAGYVSSGTAGNSAVSLTYGAVPDATKTWTKLGNPATIGSLTSGKYVTVAQVNDQTGFAIAGGNAVQVVK